MKKILAMILAMAMILTLSVTVFAAESTYEDGNWTPEGGNSQNVTVTVDSQTEADKVYYVVVNWESMAFTYSQGSEGTWNTETHKYDNVVAPKWEDDTAIITVTNHSNVAVTASATFAENATSATNFGVTATITGDGSIATADNEEYRTDADSDGKADSAPTTTFTVTVSGAPNDEYTAEANVVGTITITIS